MRGKRAAKVIGVLFVTALLTWIAFMGLKIQSLNINIPSVQEKVQYGIDIMGGVRVVLEARKDAEPTEQEMDNVVDVLARRLDAQQMFDRTITPQKAQGRVIVEIPREASQDKVFDPLKQVAELGSTQSLMFYEMAQESMNEETINQLEGIDESTKQMLLNQTIPVKVGEPIITGADVVNAQPQAGDEMSLNAVNNYYVILNLKPDGQKKFEEATTRLIGKQIGIFLDDELISAPVVNGIIPAGSPASIELNESDRETAILEARRLSGSINSGALPFALDAIEVNSVSPLLGVNALNVMVFAGAIAIGLVWLFMILYYRIPGIFACITLLLNVVVQMLFIAWGQIPLTLPGIAGIILTIGMGVDANIIIFERVREELKLGKTLRASIEIGFTKAIGAILDANVTTLISGVILYSLGTGPVKSFAITLMLGVFLSFITAITASKILLRSLSNANLEKNRWMYGA